MMSGLSLPTIPSLNHFSFSLVTTSLSFRKDIDMMLELSLLTISFLNQLIFFPGDYVFVFPYRRGYDVETFVAYTGTARDHGMIP